VIVKAALHLHTNDDPEEKIGYSAFEAIDKASQAGFSVMAITCHNKVVDIQKYTKYAESKKILLIQGIELSIKHQHVVILNCNKEAEEIKSFKELRLYKKNHPEIYIFAPHPFFYLKECLKNNLIKEIDIFDGIEFNYFYHKLFNPNKKAIKIANQYHKALIGTSDIHFLEFFDKTYTLVTLENLNTANFINALRKNQLEVITKSFSILQLFKLLCKMLLIQKKNVQQEQK
jgi:predicted metal-dependent phosphoesterase TrpH